MALFELSSFACEIERNTRLAIEGIVYNWSLLTLRKLMACSRVVLVKLTKFSIASSVGSEAILGDFLWL